MGLKKTPLYDIHKTLGAKLTAFAGFEMPVEYSSLMKEHASVRNACGIFDVSHMGEIEITGYNALKAVDLITTNNASALKDGQCQYTLVCNPMGGVIDDVIVHRISGARFLFCVNASNTEKAYGWIKENVSVAEVKDVSGDYAQIAFQGPMAEAVLKPLCELDPSLIKRFHFVLTKVCGEKTLVSRTGYTGEDGFELYMEPSKAVKIWVNLMEAGKKSGILPCGLGARDTLRLEMGYPLYGHELDEEITPVESGLKKFVSLEKKNFIGRDVLSEQIKNGASKTLVGFSMEEDGIARQHHEIFKDGKAVGKVTSGTFSPSLRRAIGMGYVPPKLAGEGAGIEINIRGKAKKAKITAPPFYRKKQPATVV